MAFPTSNKAGVFGNGATVFEGFAAVAQLLPKPASSSFRRARGNANGTKTTHQRRFLAQHSRHYPHRRSRLRVAVSPMVEVLADRELADGKKTNWDRRLRLLSASCSTYARTLGSKSP